MLIAVIHDAGLTDLEAISNNCGVDERSLGILLRDERIPKWTFLGPREPVLWLIDPGARKHIPVDDVAACDAQPGQEPSSA